MLTDLSDELLMRRYCDGDLAAFKEIYGRHSGALYRFIVWRSPRKEWADEIVQDCWISLHHARARYRADASFRTYLFQIAHNRLIDFLRQNQPQLASDLGIDEAGEDVFERLADAHHDAHHDANHDRLSPEEILIKKQETVDLHAAIRALPGEQKEALVLQQFNGMSLDEIAQVTAVPVETIKSRIRYAMRKLRQQFIVDGGAREEIA